MLGRKSSTVLRRVAVLSRRRRDDLDAVRREFGDRAPHVETVRNEHDTMDALLAQHFGRQNGVLVRRAGARLDPAHRDAEFVLERRLASASLPAVLPIPSRPRSESATRSDAQHARRSARVPSVSVPSVSPPYSGALRRMPPPRMTIAFASTASPGAMAGTVSTNPVRKSATIGIEITSSSRTPVAASARPTRWKRESRISPSPASSSGPVGGSTNAFKIAFTHRNSIIAGMLSTRL